MWSDSGKSLHAGAAYRAALAAAALVLGACGGKQPATAYAPVGDVDGGGRPFARDAGPVPSLDAGSYDHVVRSGDNVLCGYDDAGVFELPGNAQHPGIAIANDEQSFAMAYLGAEGALWIEAMAALGARDDAVPIVAAADAPSAAVLATSGAHVLLVWSAAGGDAGPVLYARELSRVDHPALELTRTLAPSAGGVSFAALGLDDAFVVAFVDGASASRALRVQRIDAAGASGGDALSVDGVAERGPQDLHLARLEAGRVLVGWFEQGDAGVGSVMALTLSPELAAEGEPFVLSQLGVYAPPFDLAARRASAGVVYQARDGDVRDTVKYRRIAADGGVGEPAFNLVDAPGRARDGSIAPFGQGYAVAYRALPSLAVEQPSVRVAFINQFGVIVYQADLGLTSEAGGRTSVSATADGHVLVTWTSAAPSSASVHGVQMNCPGALVLCGGAP